MNIDHRNPRLRRGFAFVALAAVLGLSAVGLTQCRMVDDTVTGVNVRSSDAFTPGPHPQCIHACNDAYKRCVRQVEANYKTCKANCIAAGGNVNACIKQCQKTRQTDHKRCVTEMQFCKKHCRYREGSGSAGR
jgi:hypothetical protein